MRTSLIRQNPRESVATDIAAGTTTSHTKREKYSQRKSADRSVRATPPRLLRLGDDTQIRLGRLPAGRVFLLRLLVRHRRKDDDVVALLPVHGCGDFVLGRELYRVEDPQHFVEVAAGAHGIAELKLDLLVRADYEYRAHGGIVSRSTALGSIPALCRQHAIELGDIELRIADHRVVDLVALSLLDIGCPLAVIAHRVDAQPDNFGVSLGEFRLEPRHIAEFGGAHGSKVFRVGKQDRPAVADPFVKADRALRGSGSEIGGCFIDSGDPGCSVGYSCGAHDFLLAEIQFSRTVQEVIDPPRLSKRWNAGLEKRNPP